MTGHVPRVGIAQRFDGCGPRAGRSSTPNGAGQCWQDACVGSPQTLSEADRRIVAAWAADCAERVLGLFEAEAPGQTQARAEALLGEFR